jgi:hypothetical protein
VVFWRLFYKILYGARSGAAENLLVHAPFILLTSSRAITICMEQPSNPTPRTRRPAWVWVLIVLLIILGVVMTAIFGIRLMRLTQELRVVRNHPQLTDVEMIRPWMTIPFISRGYHVPESVLWQGWGIPEAGNRQKNLRNLDLLYADGQPDAILNKVKAIISEYEAQHPRSPSPNQNSPYLTPAKL